MVPVLNLTVFFSNCFLIFIFEYLTVLAVDMKLCFEKLKRKWPSFHNNSLTVFPMITTCVHYLTNKKKITFIILTNKDIVVLPEFQQCCCSTCCFSHQQVLDWNLYETNLQKGIAKEQSRNRVQRWQIKRYKWSIVADVFVHFQRPKWNFLEHIF